ncbi:MAG: RHS repeat domain-containing protein [Fimbriimonadales bacterium]
MEVPTMLSLALNSADVLMGYDGENRRVWVQDGIGRREYTYDAWGRVRRQQGCCGDQAGISVVAVEASYDPAGRRREIQELTEGNFSLRTITTTYDELGRVREVISEGRRGVYHYDSAGRLWKEQQPNGIIVCYTYYGSEEPSQRGFLKAIEFGFGDCDAPERDVLLRYEYRYDVLGRVVWSKELPSGDELSYSYTAAGRLESEARTGDLAYYRVYSYRSDGRRAWVLREDGLRGFSLDVYFYDEASGRLERVEGSDGVHRFGWSEAGQLVWWASPEVNYKRVYRYDEEGRMVRIERDYGGGDMRPVYEAQYNGDGFRVWDKEWLWEVQNPPLVQEYRYVCGVGCGRLPMRVYRNADGWWVSYEWYVRLLDSVWYSGYEFESSYTWLNADYPLLSGHLLIAELLFAPWGEELMYDRFGVFVGERFHVQKVKRRPRYLREHVDVLPGEYVPTPAVPPINREPRIPNPWFPKKPKPLGPITDFCNGTRIGSDVYEARKKCLEWFNTSEGSVWFEQCQEYDPDCSIDIHPMECCLLKCMEAAGAGTGAAGEAVECLLKGYGGVWRGL